MSRLVLIDGSSYLYRAFHALPPLTNAQGEPTGALFGVVNMLRATLKERPAYIAFVVDAPGKTFRDDLYADYKANRPSMPDDLRAQVQPMCDIVHALGIDILRIDGVEADDVIGTLALQAAADGLSVTISTGDKDFAQLVRPGIELVNTMSGSRMDSDEAVIAKFGVRPDQIVDLLALMGDTVDNVPGVEKCGPKTAAKWLAEYDSLDGVIANADKIKGKIGDNLRAALPRLPLNRELVTIKTDVTLASGPRALDLREPNTETLAVLYARYGFTQALREMGGTSAQAGLLSEPVALGAAAATARTEPGRARGTGFVSGPVNAAVDLDPALSAPGEYETILTQEQLDSWIVQLRAAGQFAFDTETDSLDPLQADLIGLSVAAEPGKAAYLPFGHNFPGAPVQLDRTQALAQLVPLLTDPAVRKLGQHGKYDLHVMRRHGVELAGYAHDTLLESFVLNSGSARHDMDSLAKRYLGYDTVKYEDVCGKGAKQIPFAQISLEDATRYAAEDADITLRLHHVLGPKLAAEPGLERVYREIEMPLVDVLARIEANGVCVDAAELRRQSADLSKRMLAAQQKATELAGRTFNLDSPKQLQALLFDELKLPAVVKTPKGQPSTNEEALEAIADQHELPRVILEYRGLTKLRSTYTDKLPEMIHPQSGRVHTSYHQAGAATGRLSSSDPNLQNIPIRTEDGRRIRRAFVAPAGRKLIACDYSQIELRIMAHLSGDPGLVGAFESGADVHRATAAEVFGRTIDTVSGDERRAAKAINFGLMYGMSAFGLARQLGIGRGEAQDYIALYFSRYPGVRDFMETTRQQARDKGYVETVFGRRLYLDFINAGSQGQRAGAERAAINAPMQGTAADIIKRAMVSVDGWIAGHAQRAKMILQVHDELVFEADTDFVDTLLSEVTTRMASAAELRVPLVVDSGIGDNWDEAH
ncbi:TPA: DNA polymerase I [Xanthomonas vasicola pv. zeae]|uniref:DNA polymerase I n=4 Tax=Xanthomonas vasicola TaxID=56459 RepID=A0AAE8F9E8_XANVA|nr:DNA polymerase I [Xanthomonas vasicola]AVQ08728.1 DNA polymerase I [Xanthomonas vasicola pv. vasculorum]AZM72976.1 DNA polymerase I [Xanthomonas vasicola pv. vasculorum]AZR28616.1 DNA polymerase I [Xanthomonas vasicola pv. arecae]AZR32143.1 DNA polymerase I [Xanthomonas vasicola pv. musacearum NCPPB 4379]KFA09902.1 DNA polymerase I [Xanthomonas vasicola pv. musacearum NCPPB 2005]